MFNAAIAIFTSQQSCHTDTDQNYNFNGQLWQLHIKYWQDRIQSDLHYFIAQFNADKVNWFYITIFMLC